MLTDLTFTYATPKLGMRRNVMNVMIGTYDRHGVFRQFLKDNNIDDPRDVRTRNVTRSKYLIKTHYVEHLADSRDQLALSRAAKLQDMQKSLRTQLETTRLTLQAEKAVLSELVTQMKEVKASLSNADLKPLEKVHHQDNLGTLRASAINQKAAVSRLEKRLVETADTLLANVRRFEKFLAEASAVYELSLNNYTQRAGRLLHKNGCTNFDAILRDYETDLQTQIKELQHGIKDVL